MTTIRRITKELVLKSGWKTGTDIEDRVSWQLHRWGFVLGDVVQQHRAGRYRLDFAWPKLLVALEVDGPYHRQPVGALRDAVRDSWLRGRGWLVFRIDDESGDLDEQLLRVVLVVRDLQDHLRDGRAIRHA